MKKPYTLLIYKLLLNKSRSSNGFTLVELLVAIILAGIVVVAATGGLTAILSYNQESEINTQRRIELNRALDYIAEDIRSATSVAATSGNDGIELSIPDAANRSFVVTPATSTWISPYTINRGDGIALIDGIEAPATAPSCDAGETFTGADGFYACIGADSRTVDLFIYGRLLDGEYYEASTTVFARSSPAPAPSPSPSPSP